MLFKRSLHEVKRLLESQQYQKYLSAVEIAAARQKSIMMDGIAEVLNSQTCTTGCSFSCKCILKSILITTTTTSTGSPFRCLKEGVKMAEAAWKSQEATVLDTKYFEAMIKLQHL